MVIGSGALSAKRASPLLLPRISDPGSALFTISIDDARQMKASFHGGVTWTRLGKPDGCWMAAK